MSKIFTLEIIDEMEDVNIKEKFNELTDWLISNGVEITFNIKYVKANK